MTPDRLAQDVAEADHTLNDGLVIAILSLLTGPHPQSLDPGELLLPLGPKGTATSLSSGVVDRVQDALVTTPGLAGWLQPVVVNGDRVLLVARRLCHRVGLRHRTVQVILDHPTHHDYTLIQVRGFEKVDAPGAFDLPCAGHVIGTASTEASLEKELGEELGLRVEDLVDLRLIAHYEYRDLDQRPDFANVEYRTVYRARLRAGALERVRFADAEVAGLVMIPIATVRALVTQYPGRVASGLRGAVGWYGAA